MTEGTHLVTTEVESSKVCQWQLVQNGEASTQRIPKALQAAAAAVAGVALGVTKRHMHTGTRDVEVLLLESWFMEVVDDGDTRSSWW